LTLFVSGVVVSCVNFIPLYFIASKEAGTSTMLHIGPVTGQIVGSLCAVILIGAALIAIGTLISALTENQLSAAVVTIGVLCVMVLLNMVNNITDSEGNQIIGSYAIRAVINWLSVLNRYANFGYGIFDFAALLYYVSLIAVFIFLTIRVYEKRRWG
jgi:ABC-2 type transport system permease protein